MYTKNFLAQYGSPSTREKLSAENGRHEPYLYGFQEPTKKMLDNSLDSSNYNARVTVIKTGKLDHEQVEKALSKGDVHRHVLENYRLHPDKLKELAQKDTNNNHTSEIFDNANHSSRPQSERVHALRTLLNTDNPHITREMAYSAHDVPKELHPEIVHKIISSNNAVNARRYVETNIGDHPDNTEKLLTHFPAEGAYSLHKFVARNSELKDSRIKEYLKDPELHERLQTNMKLTNNQSRMVPGHIFSELDLLKREG